MTKSKSCLTCKALMVALLVVWGLASLVIIAVWAAHPERASTAHCGGELQEAREKLEGAKVVWSQDKVALEEMVEELRLNATKQQQHLHLLLGRMEATSALLDACSLGQVALRGNITVLEEQIEKHRDKEANLTGQILLHQDEIETLEQNVTLASHHTDSCKNLNAAAVRQKLAAESYTKACESTKQYLEKQLLKCKEVRHHSSEQSAVNGAQPLASGPLASGPLASILTATLQVWLFLHLIS